MTKHVLIELLKIIEERIGSLTEEVGITTNVELHPLYIVDRKDEIESLQWTTRIIRWVLDRAMDGRQKLGVSRVRLGLEDAKKFENMLHDKIQELEIELEDSNTDREKETIVNQVDTLKCVLEHLFNLKYGEKVRAVGIAEAKNNFQQAKHLKKQLRLIHKYKTRVEGIEFFDYVHLNRKLQLSQEYISLSKLDCSSIISWHLGHSISLSNSVNTDSRVCASSD